MFLIALGALMIVGGVVLAATRQASRGKLSDPHAKIPGERIDTLEPRGRGHRLSVKPDIPGIALVIVGAVLVFAGASG